MVDHRLRKFVILLLTRTLITNLTFISIEHLQRVRHANRGRLILRISCPVPFVTCISSHVEAILS